MIKIKNPKEIAAMREAGQLVAETFAQLEPAVKPGVSLQELDRLATEYLTSRGAQTLYKGYRGNPPSHPPFPGVICASVNSEICHGLPDQRILREGDIVGVDIGLRYRGFCGDACVTYGVGQISAAARRLLDVTRESLARGIAAARPGANLGEIGAAIQAYVEAQRFSVVREWGGHGIGRELHEEPSVPHHGPAGLGPKLRPGMIFTVEPMINAGRPEWKLLADGWTVVTVDGSLSAQFEHTLVVTEGEPEILSKV